jgi:hypothetical protein
VVKTKESKDPENQSIFPASFAVKFQIPFAGFCAEFPSVGF